MTDLVEEVARAMHEREHPNAVWSRGRASPLWFFRAEAAIAVMIERCAKVAEEKYEDAGWHGNYQSAGRSIADAIRKLGESE